MACFYLLYNGLFLSTLQWAVFIYFYSPMNPFFDNSTVSLLVIFSSSFSEYVLGSIFTPALAPPKGTSTTAHLYVISCAKAFTSSSFTSML